MAKIDSMRLLRARLGEFTRTPWALLLLFAGDLVELGASIGLALTTPPPAAPKVAYTVIDVPVAPTQVTLSVAIMGIIAGLVMGVALVAELWVIVRRAQIFNYRYGRAAERRRPNPRSPGDPGPSRSGRAGLARGPVT
ncbi:hypothetical protein A7982_12016 [Minicystis rosea]|nr:hypothetical protein A7982_12016 [Minicystis rosea]